MRIQELENKNVAVWGYGKEGRATVELLQRNISRLKLTVLNDVEIESDANSTEMDFIYGENVYTALSSFDVVIKSPGISPYQEAVIAAMRKGTVFTSATRIWFAEHPDARTICVTGTKGKSTTASLIAHLMRSAGFRVMLAGNIGTPLTGLFDITPPPDFWVIELSSYQTSDFDGSPTAAVLLNLYPEHLDWHGTVTRYYRDKLHLFSRISDGAAILNRKDEQSADIAVDCRHRFYFNDIDGFHIENGYICDGRQRLISTRQIKLRGGHNLSNICAAMTALRAVGLEPHRFLDAIPLFEGLPHRLSVLGERNGILYIDDSISTTPQSTIAALESFPDRWVTVLVGGYDRGLDYDGLCRYLCARTSTAVATLPESGRRIARRLKEISASGRSSFPIVEGESLIRAVDLAKSMTPRGGIILLSPAAPSYGAFKNFRERGRVFAHAAGFEGYISA